MTLAGTGSNGLLFGIWIGIAVIGVASVGARFGWRHLWEFLLPRPIWQRFVRRDDKKPPPTG